MKLRNWSEFSLAGVTNDDGTVDVEHKVLVFGKQAQRNKSGKLVEFEVTREDAAEMARNHATDQAVGYEPPIFLGHPADRSTAEALGWIKRVRVGEDGVYATLSFRREAAEAIREGAYRYVSPTFVGQYEDQRGNPCGAKLLDIGVLNTPHQKDLGPIPLAESAYQLSEVEASQPGGDDPICHDTAAGDSMSITKEELATALGAALADFEKKQDEKIAAKFAEFTAGTSKDEPTAMAALSASVDSLAQQIVELKASAPKSDPAAENKLVLELKAIVKEQGDTVADLKRAKEQRDICDLIQLGVDAGTLEIAEAPGFGTDRFDAPKWLGESRFNGIRGLRMHVATSKPVATPARKSAPTGDVRKDVELSEIPFSSAHFASREEFEKFVNAGSSRAGSAVR